MILGELSDGCPSCGSGRHEGRCKKAWHLTARPQLKITDRLRVLFGIPLFVRFTSPDGDCHAGCGISVAVQRDWPGDWHILESWPRGELTMRSRIASWLTFLLYVGIVVAVLDGWWFR